MLYFDSCLEKRNNYDVLVSKESILNVFDTTTFTVDGAPLESYEKNGIEYIADGYFHESEYRSAPYFDLRIDGITLLDEQY